MAKVIKGKNRGRKLGFPTINLVLPSDLELEPGVYACWVRFPQQPKKKYMGALHFGPIPVFEEPRLSLEVHLLDYQEKETPSSLKIKIIKFLRKVRDFDSVEKLIKQIAKDVDRTRKILSS